MYGCETASKTYITGEASWALKGFLTEAQPRRQYLRWVNLLSVHPSGTTRGGVYS